MASQMHVIVVVKPDSVKNPNLRFTILAESCRLA